MHVRRRLALLGAAGVGAAALAGPALAARPSGLPNTIASAHFLVHFQSDATTTYPITQTQAADIAATAEKAYAAELADGYPAPPSDGALGGDSRIDIYVVDLSAQKVLGETVPDTGGSPTTASILLDGTSAADAFTLHTIAHELFHVFQLGIWSSPNASDDWLYEGSAEWMGYRVDSYGGSFELGPDDMSLDCSDPNGLSECNLTDAYENNGYSRWPFFEYLGEVFGYSFAKDIFAQGAAGAPSATAALADAIAAKGTTLATVYNNWSTLQMSSGYTVAALQGKKPTAYATVQTGVKSGALATQTVAVNHLATRYIEFDRGDGDSTSACFAATLTLTVTIPSGTLSQPEFYWNGTGSTPVPLAISGSTATASIPWDTCTWGSNQGYLSLPNASQNVDAALFTVASTLSVDTTKPASPGSAPAQATLWGTVIPVTSAPVVPQITVFGPEVLTVNTGDTQLRLIVQSDAQGSLKASLGDITLGTGALRPGENDLRFTLPASLRQSVRRSAALANVLTLTPVSTDGTATGTAVTRQVAFATTTNAPVVKAKTKAKRHKTR